jgi:proteasome lid subunit RPN8/RPN11
MTSQPRSDVLRFSPSAWAKLLWFCHAGGTEIGGFGISSPTDPLLVEEFVTVKQETSAVTVSFDDLAVAEFFENQVDLGRKPEQFARIWLHTHPGSSPDPSATDEETFARVFGKCNWSVMFILSRTGRTYARMQFDVGPKGSLRLPVEVDFSTSLQAGDPETWKKEYLQHVQPLARLASPWADFQDWAEESPRFAAASVPLTTSSGVAGDAYALMDSLTHLDVVQRELFMDLLAERFDLWKEEGEICDV